MRNFSVVNCFFDIKAIHLTKSPLKGIINKRYR